MDHNYASFALAAALLLGGHAGQAQSAKPQPVKQVRMATAHAPAFRHHNAVDVLRGGGVPNECADALQLTVGNSCTPVNVSAAGATQSLDPILCNGFTSGSANDVWVTFTATSAATVVEVLGTGVYDAVLEIFTGTCGSLTSIGCVDNTFPPNSTLEVANIVGDPGTTYYMRIYTYTPPAITDDSFTICAYQGANPPANDNCSGAVAQTVAVGSTVTFSGDNTGATENIPGFVLVWEAFTLTSCSNVVINYCLAGSEFDNFLVNLAVNCPDILEGLLLGEFDDCTVTFEGLPAATYYIPVLVSADTPQGAYSISVSTTACPPGYCNASAAECDEYIARVQFGAIDNSSDCADGPVVDYTSISTNMEAGANMAITVTNGPDIYAGDQVVVWVDWNQNENFLDVGESYALTTADDSQTFTGVISAPVNAVLGSTRMRIRMMYTGTPSPCGGSPYGEVEDYTVVVDAFSSVSEGSAAGWNVFPNPGNGDFTILYGGADDLVVMEVMDMTGRLVHTAQQRMGNGQLVELPLAGQLASGTYVLRLSSSQGHQDQRIVVR